MSAPSDSSLKPYTDAINPDSSRDAGDKSIASSTGVDSEKRLEEAPPTGTEDRSDDGWSDWDDDKTSTLEEQNNANLLRALMRQFDAMGKKEQKRRIAGVGPAYERLRSDGPTVEDVPSGQTSQQAPGQMKRPEVNGGKDLEVKLHEFEGRCVQIDGQYFILPKPQVDSEKEFDE